LERYVADLKRPDRRGASSREDLMVEIRVAVADATGAHGLLRRLTELFDRSSVSFDRKRNEVRVRSEWESRSVVQVIGTVESWLAADGVGSAKLSIGDRSYTMVRPAAAQPEAG
jgi:hypothetical protein